MPSQSSSQRKRVASSQTDQTAPTQPKQERKKYAIWVHARAGVIKRDEKFYTPEELEAEVAEIAIKGISQQSSPTRIVFFSASSIEKIEIVRTI